MKKFRLIVLNAIPIVIMIGLIPVVADDYALTALYGAIIAVSLFLQRARYDLLALVVGFFVMLASEAFFISTGVETFERNSLFGIMPLWLPFLWAYGFVVFKRSLEILNRV